MHMRMRGFTFLEQALIVAAGLVLIGILLMVFNPFERAANARNDQRQADINAILETIYLYSLDTGVQPYDLLNLPPNVSYKICRTGAASCDGLVDISFLTADQRYLIALPIDPLAPTDGNTTGYEIVATPARQIEIHAPLAEKGEYISVSQ